MGRRGRVGIGEDHGPMLSRSSRWADAAAWGSAGQSQSRGRWDRQARARAGGPGSVGWWFGGIVGAGIPIPTPDRLTVRPAPPCPGP